MNRRLAAWSEGDAGKAGLATVLRAAGTANHKRYPRVDLVTGELTETHAWNPEIMDQAVPLPDPPRPTTVRKPYDGPAIDLADYLDNVEIISEITDGTGIKYAIVCPWVSEHTGGDRTGTRVGQRSNGALWFHCDHEHCQGRAWHEFKHKVHRRKKVLRITRPGYTGPATEVRIYG
jgi:hypothetical protein